MANLKRKERRNLTVLMATERAMYNKKFINRTLNVIA
jgi:hypothetical protein